MRHIIKRLFLTLVYLAFFNSILFSQDSIHFRRVEDTAFLQFAKAENKPILIYFTGTGCTLCVKMEKNVFTKEEVYNLYNSKFVNLEAYSDSRKPNAAIENLRTRYGIVSNPSFLFITQTGTVIHKGGYSDDKKFVQLARQALSDDNYAAWQAIFRKGVYPAKTVADYLAVETSSAFYNEENYECASQRVLDKYFLSIKEVDYLSAFNWDIIKKYVYDPHSHIFTFLVANQKKYSEKYGPKEVDKKIFNVYDIYCSGNTATTRYKQAKKEIESSTVIQAKKWVYIKLMNEKARKIIANDKSWDDFILENNQFIISNPHLINTYEVTFDWVEHICKTNNSVAIRAANNWVKYILAEPENQDAYYYEVYAKTFYLLNDKLNAMRNLKKAIELAKQNNNDKEDILAMEKNLITYNN